jgi:hypothetical protein
MPSKNKVPLSLYFKNLRINLRFYDKLTLGYLWLILTLVAFSSKSLSIKGPILISHLIATLIVVLLVHIAHSQIHPFRQRPIWPWLKFLRDWHPLFLFTFLLFGEFTHLSNIILPYWIENFLIRFDFWLFGQSPYQFIVQYVPQWAIKLMAFAYWSYYPLVLGVVCLHYFNSSISIPDKLSRLCQAKFSFVDCMNRLCLTFYCCYVLFMLLPARSPRHALSLGNNVFFTGGIFLDLVSAIQNYSAVVGAAFPSSHVAVAWVAVLALRHNYRYICLALLPLVTALTISVFILQYHYVLDAVGGVVVALLVELLWRQDFALKRRQSAANLLEAPMPAAAKNSVT